MKRTTFSVDPAYDAEAKRLGLRADALYLFMHKELALPERADYRFIRELLQPANPRPER